MTTINQVFTSQRQYPNWKVECFTCYRHGHNKLECQANLNKNGGGKSNFT